MSLLSRLPRRLRVVLLGANLAGSLVALAANWASTYANLIASWVIAATAVSLAAPVAAWVGRRLDARQEHIARRAAEHTAAHLAAEHDATRAHVAGQISQHAAALADQIAALHVRLDALTQPPTNRQGGD